MNKIHRLIFAIAILLTTLGVHAADYKIEAINISGSGEVTAKMGETTITTNTTPIPENTEVTLTVTPTSPGFYLKSLSYEEVTDLGQAQAPRHRADPTFQNIHTIPLSNANDHFGGDYTFRMPKNNVIITAVFGGLDSFNDSGKTFTFSISGDATYDGTVRSLIVNDGSTQLTEGLDFRITAMTLNGSSTGEDYTIQKAGNYVVTVQGIGKYQDSKESGTLTINHKALTITAKNQTYQYSVGGAISPGTNWVTTDGLVAEDNLTGIALTQSTSNATGSTPGTITPSAATTTYGIANYNVTYTNGILTINPLAVGETATGTKAIVTLTGPTTDSETDIRYYNHNGSIQIPSVTVTHLSSTLVENIDYTLTTTAHYFPGSIDYIKPDIYTITVTFKGNYSGSMTAEYQIRKKVELNNATDFRWSTYYDSDYNIQVGTNEKFKAYTISAINSNSVEIVERNYIKKEIPMLLYKKGTDEYSYPPLVKTVSDWGTMVDFYKANTTERDVTTIQTAEGGKEIWILVRDQFVRTRSGAVPANKCYLALGSSTLYPSPMHINSHPTRIDAPPTEFIDLKGSWYTIDGRELHGIPTEKGLYITNGKKIIIK